MVPVLRRRSWSQRNPKPVALRAEYSHSESSCVLVLDRLRLGNVGYLVLKCRGMGVGYVPCRLRADSLTYGGKTGNG